MGFMRQFQCHLKISMWICIQITLNVHNCYNFNYTRPATPPYSSIHPCIILQQASSVHIAIQYYSRPVFLNLHSNDIWGQIISYSGMALLGIVGHLAASHQMVTPQPMTTQMSPDNAKHPLVGPGKLSPITVLDSKNTNMNKTLSLPW